MFEPGVLPEVFSQARERRTRKPLTQEVLPQEAASAEDIAAEIADGEAIKAEIIENEGEGRLVVIIVEPEATEATVEAEAQPKDNESAQKPTRKGKGMKGAASTEDAGM